MSSSRNHSPNKRHSLPTSHFPKSPPNSSSHQRGPMKRHSLWHYFEFNEEIKRSNCKHCAYNVAGNYTTTLKTHLKNHHGQLYVEMERKEAIRMKNLPMKRNASANNVLEEAKKGKLANSTQNLPFTSQPGGIVAISIAGPDISAAFKVPRSSFDDQEDGVISNLNGFLTHAVKKEPLEDDSQMPQLELEEEPSTSTPPTLEKNFSYSEMLLSQTHPHGKTRVGSCQVFSVNGEIEPEEDDFDSFQIPNVTTCLKKFHKKIMELSKENKMLKLNVGLLEERVKTLEEEKAQAKNAFCGPNKTLTNGYKKSPGQIEAISEFHIDTQVESELNNHVN